MDSSGKPSANVGIKNSPMRKIIIIIMIIIIIIIVRIGNKNMNGDLPNDNTVKIGQNT